jgi:hypothetical protein
MTISYWEGRTPPPPGAGIEPVVEQPCAPELAAKAGPAPTWRQTIPLTGTAEGGMAFVGVRCTNMPTDGFVSFSLAPPGDLGIPKTPITRRDMTLLLSFHMPAHYQGEMTLTYWQGPTMPPPDAAIAPVAQLEASNMVQLARFLIAR